MATKIQVVFYSTYGHAYQLAEALAAGAREVDGTEVSMYLVPDDILEKSGARAARSAYAQVPVARPEPCQSVMPQQLGESHPWICI